MTAIAKKSVAILQSSYIPWKGYFDIIHQVDEFIIFDSRQYTSRDWRNRNQIKTKDGLMIRPEITSGFQWAEGPPGSSTWVDSCRRQFSFSS